MESLTADGSVFTTATILPQIRIFIQSMPWTEIFCSRRCHMQLLVSMCMTNNVIPEALLSIHKLLSVTIAGTKQTCQQNSYFRNVWISPSQKEVVKKNDQLHWQIVWMKALGPSVNAVALVDAKCRRTQASSSVCKQLGGRMGGMASEHEASGCLMFQNFQRSRCRSIALGHDLLLP
jgi:hypothetical protein